MPERIIVSKPVIVEGKYDKIKLESIIEAKIITTDGFGVFKAAEKTALIRRLADKTGVIIITDSDGAGLLIRNYFNSILPKNKVTHLYIPDICGKERRKKAPSKEGLLGVEGIDSEKLREIFRPFSDSANTNTVVKKREVTKRDFYIDGLSGSDGSAERREQLAKRLGLPRNMSANAMLDAINLLYDYSQYKELVGNEY